MTKEDNEKESRKTMDTGYSKWRKLDNAALAFPLVSGKNDTRVFRFYCQLKEKVDGEILQSALDQTMEKYPLFQAVLRKGLFWFYLEHRDIRAVVKQETEPPCSRLYIPDKKSLLFQVTYDKDRINFEVFHALTDGTGAMHFLQELVQNYLILAHPQDDIPRIENAEEVTHGDKEEDSFSQYYSSDMPKNKEKKETAVKLKGEKLVHSDMHITEVVLSVKDIHQKARSYGASITVLLTAMMLCSIREEIPKNQQKRPVTLMIPVNLRNYFPSQSMTNFFGWIEVGYTFSETTTFEEVVADAQTQDLVIQQIRDLHCNHLGGITWANFNDPTFEPNAELLQKTMGYRFLLSNFSYPTSIKPDEPFKISFDVTNTGSSPFYYDWPVEIALLNSQTQEVVWSKTLETPKISQWMPGDNWNNSAKVYTQPAATNHIEEELTLDKKLDTGDYIIAISVLDPSGMLPSLRFAIQNYFEGGRHPMGHIGVNTEPVYFEIPTDDFDDMRQDKTLKYKIQ